MGVEPGGDVPHALIRHHVIESEGGGRRGEGERDKRLHSPFALHAPIHQAMLEVCDQEQGMSSRLVGFRVEAVGMRVESNLGVTSPMLLYATIS